MKFEKNLIKFSEIPLGAKTTKEHVTSYHIERNDDDSIKSILVTLETFRFYLPEWKFNDFIEIVEKIELNDVQISIGTRKASNPELPYAKCVWIYHSNI